MRGQKRAERGEGREREAVQKVCLLDSQHESGLVDVVNWLELTTIKIFRRHVALKEAAREQYRQEDRFLEQAGQGVKDTVIPRLEEAWGVSNTIEQDDTCDSESNQQLNYLVLLIIVVAINDVGELRRDVSEG